MKSFQSPSCLTSPICPANHEGPCVRNAHHAPHTAHPLHRILNSFKQPDFINPTKK